jgi:excisionase family DNA binding protein
VESPWLDAGQAADYLSMTEAAVRAAVRRGKIPFERTPLGQLRFDREALDAWVRG